MIVAVVGSREYPVHKLRYVGELVRSLPPDTLLISGGAAGVDDRAALAGRAAGLKVKELKVETTGLPEDLPDRRVAYAKRAYARNTAIVALADQVVAFWSWCSNPRCRRDSRPHRTHGTDHVIAEARRMKKPLRLFGPDGRETH